MVARTPGGREVASSILVAPTNRIPNPKRPACRLVFFLKSQNHGGSERKGNLTSLGNEPLGPTPANLIRPAKAGLIRLAEAKGFEPSGLLPAHTISSRAPSTTRPRFRLLFYHIPRPASTPTPTVSPQYTPGSAAPCSDNSATYIAAAPSRPTDPHTHPSVANNHIAAS